MTPAAPTARPAYGFSTAKAQRWILGSAIVVAMVYMLRRFTEDDPPARGSTAARLAGHGSPPPQLAHWTIAYATGFMFLALIALPAPELAASLAMLTVTGTLLTNGTAIAADLAELQHGEVTGAGPGGRPAGPLGPHGLDPVKPAKPDARRPKKPAGAPAGPLGPGGLG